MKNPCMLIEIEENNKITLPKFITDKINSDLLKITLKGDKIILEIPKDTVILDLDIELGDEGIKFMDEECENRKISQNFLIQEILVDMLLKVPKLSIFDKIKYLVGGFKK